MYKRQGYNGFTLGCSDDEFTWAREGEDNKYFYSTHSELNAILNYRGDVYKRQPGEPLNPPNPAAMEKSVQPVNYTNITNQTVKQEMSGYKMCIRDRYTRV